MSCNERTRLDTLLRVAAEHSFHHSIEDDMLCEDSPALATPSSDSAVSSSRALEIFAVGYWWHSGHLSRGLRAPVLCASGDPICTKPHPFSLAAGSGIACLQDKYWWRSWTQRAQNDGEFPTPICPDTGKLVIFCNLLSVPLHSSVPCFSFGNHPNVVMATCDSSGVGK